VVVALVLPFGSLFALAAPNVADSLSQTQVGQQQLQNTTTRVAQQIAAIVDEFKRHGLAGEEVQLLSAIRAVLGKLSEEDMARVVALLQQARTENEPNHQRAPLIDAFGTQKSVGVKLRQILLEYQRQQELAAIAARLSELASRQHVALRETLSLAESAAGRKRDWLTENQRISLQLQLSEQQSLRDEVAGLITRLRNWSSETDNEAAARAADAVSRPETDQLGHLLDATVADLETGRLLSATGRQRGTRGAMRALARLLVPASDELEALQAALNDVRDLIQREGETQQTTRQLSDRPADIQQVSRRQGALVDDADVVRAEVVELDTAAGEQVGAALGRMQEARGAIDQPRAEVRARRLLASTQQELALARLESASRLLQQRIDSLQRQREAMVDPLSNLRQVREDIEELLRREEELKTSAAKVEDDPSQLRPLAPQQGDLGDRAGDTAARASLDSQEVAEQINEATLQMRRSQRSLGEGQNDPGAQQAALDALSRALASLDRQLAELEAAARELAELDDLLQRLIAIIEAQQTLITETARLARALEARPSVEVGRDQTTLAGATRLLEGDIPASVPQAATYVSEAATQMVLAGGELDAERPSAARPPQDMALENLLHARRVLEERMAQLQQMLGLPTDDALLEELAKMIKEAQQDVNSAMSAEALRAMARDLQQAQSRIRPATSGRLGRMPRMIREPLQAADQALNEGTAAAEGGDQPSASSEAARAQEALAAAAAALDLAMAGMGQSGEGQGGQGQQAGQGQGRGRGRTPGSRAGKGTGDAGNFFGQGGADGARRDVEGKGRFIGLPARERAALLQSQGEDYPQDYAPMIEQYLKNLSDQVGEEPR
jgi:hypothetical protein